MGCLRLFRRLSRRSSQDDDALLNSQQRRGPRPYRAHEHKPKHKHTPSEDSSFSTDFVEEKASYRGRSRTSRGSAAVPVIRPNVNPAHSAYATPEVYRYGGAGPREDDGRAPRRTTVNGEKKEAGVNDAEEQERMDFLQMM